MSKECCHKRKIDERSWVTEWLVNQPAHWATAFVPAILILWQPLWFAWLVILFPLSREYYQHHRKVTVWRRDLWFAYLGIICAYLLAFLLIRLKG